MAFKIAIASGKGGTGKTTVSVNLFYHLKKKYQQEIQLVDCDVEEPNDIIFFPNSICTTEKQIFQPVPRINAGKCNFCKRCVEFCEFNAITVLPAVQFTQINTGLCHSCGACTIACQDGAITEKDQLIGTIREYEAGFKSNITEGRLKIGSAMQTMVINKLKHSIREDSKVIIYDAPPGTSCSVVETINDTHYIILVAEPTLFGVHDFKLMVRLLQNIGKPFGVIINKSGLGNNDIYKYVKQEDIPVLGKIPFRKDYASSYANGTLFDNIPQDISLAYNSIIEDLRSKIEIT